jgi:hypothetical protein
VKKQPHVTPIVPDVDTTTPRKPKVIVARPSLDATGIVVRHNAILGGSLPIRTADVRRGDRFGFLTVAQNKFGSLGHYWSQGSWYCDCREATCIAHHYIGGTVTECGPQCECDRMGWVIYLTCDCGKADYWKITSDVLGEWDVPRLTCQYRGGIARHVENAHRSITPEMIASDGGVPDATT